MKNISIKSLFALSAGVALMSAIGCSSLQKMNDLGGFCASEDLNHARQIDNLFIDFADMTNSYASFRKASAGPAVGRVYTFVANPLPPRLDPKKFNNMMQRGTDLLLDRDKDCGYPEARKRYGEYTDIVVSYNLTQLTKSLYTLIRSMKDVGINAPSP